MSRSVIATKAQIETAYKGDFLVDDDEFLVMCPIQIPSKVVWMSLNAYTWMKALKGYFCVIAVNSQGNGHLFEYNNIYLYALTSLLLQKTIQSEIRVGDGWALQVEFGRHPPSMNKDFFLCHFNCINELAKVFF